MNGQTFSNSKSGKNNNSMKEKKGKLDEVEKLLEKKKTILIKLVFTMYVLLLQTQLEFGNQHPSVSLL